MKIFLMTTASDCFRSPEVLAWIRRRIEDGQSVAMASRDHPETLPEGILHVEDDWAAVVGARPSLAVLDNLVLDDPRGGNLRRWNGTGGRYVTDSAGALDSALNDLQDAGTADALLVCEEAVVSTGWRNWMIRQGVTEWADLYTEWVYRRCWWLMRDSDDPVYLPYRYSEGRLLKPTSPASPRRFSANVLTPKGEALLALMGEYVSSRYENHAPEDPGGLNQRDDMLHEIVEAFAGSADPRELLTAMVELFDLVTEHVDFSDSRWGRGGIASREAFMTRPVREGEET